MSNVIAPVDAFQIELAELAGLDPAQVIAGTLDVVTDRQEDGIYQVRATVLIPVDRDEVIRLAMKHGRIGPDEAWRL